MTRVATTHGRRLPVCCHPASSSVILGGGTGRRFGLGRAGRADSFPNNVKIEGGNPTNYAATEFGSVAVPTTTKNKQNRSLPTMERNRTAEEEAQRRDPIREQLIALYQKHNPKKLDDIPYLLIKYAKVEGKLLKAVQEKYESH
eukprot:scaffold1505_cov118-Cylindrotheca_fusiformis.AAC.10